MSKKDEALKLALGELQAGKVGNAMQILRKALAEQPAQVDPCIDGSCSCCWAHLDEQPRAGGTLAPKWQGARFDSALHEQPAQQEEPVAWKFTDKEGTEFFEQCEEWEGKWTPLYTSPPASKPLTDERTAFKQYIDECDKCCIVPDAAGAFHAAWQAAHGIKEKNNG